MKNIIRKNRNRENRGILNSFFDLPLEQREIFISIKKNIIEKTGKDLKCFVFGSYYWGFWDDTSDFDLSIEYNKDLIFNYSFKEKIDEVIKIFKEKNVDIDVLMIKDNNGILIP